MDPRPTDERADLSVVVVYHDLTRQDTLTGQVPGSSSSLSTDPTTAALPYSSLSVRDAFTALSSDSRQVRWVASGILHRSRVRGPRRHCSGPG